MSNEFPFEDFTLILSRDCNFKCEYCPLDHFKGNMDIEILQIFFNNLIKYNNKNNYITLFGGEPLLNKLGMKYIYDFLKEKQQLFKINKITFILKLVTNGSLIDKEYSLLFEKINKLSNVKFILYISFDGTKNTQLEQRNYKNKKIDYYLDLSNNILLLKQKGINIKFGMVLSFFNTSFIKDIMYLIKTFNIPILIMPVDLTYSYIINTKDINIKIEKYLFNLFNLIKVIKKYNLNKFILNLNTEKDIKIPPIGPAIDIRGDIYTTRDFLFTMDKKIKFNNIGNIKQDNFKKILSYFYKNKIEDLENKTLKEYYGRTFFINKMIGDFFSKNLYN